MVDYRRWSRPNRSGKLGEDFCLQEFGIREDDQYEIKSTCCRNNQVVLKNIQLLQSLSKMFVVVRYKREHRTLKRGPRKGRSVPCETMESAYRKPLDVFCADGVYLMKKIEELGRPLRSTSYENDGPWAPYWTVRMKSFPQDPLYKNDRVSVYGDELNAPAFLGDIPF